MGLMEIFKKQGGIDLLRRYWRGGALPTTIAEFVILGRSRTALELLRLSAMLKIRKKLEKRYKKRLVEFDRNNEEELEHNVSNIVWICWFQKMENAPFLVQQCYRSIKQNMPDKEIILITADNMDQYVHFPDYILDKWKRGRITHTHMTDLLRLELLITYGGMWLDATVYCSDANIPDFYFQSDLFFYQLLKPGIDGNATYLSSWLISAKSNNKILMAVRYLCYAYWNDNDYMVDYFLLHDFFSIVLDYYPEDWKKVPPKDNGAPHLLLLRLFDLYDEETWQYIKAQTPFHKLTYKFTHEQADLKETFYDVLLKQDIGSVQ